jgi:multisubunit Na+/H+ antiporter MnhC subunit
MRFRTHWMRGASILLSQSTVSRVKWIGLLVPGLCALIAVAMVHSDNRTTCAIALVLFATGIAFSILLIGCYSTPFAGEVSSSPEILKQVLSKSASGP